MRLYAYCLCGPFDAAALGDERGVGGAALRQVACGDGLAALVSAWEDEGPVGVTPDHVRAHNRVNTRVLARTTPLPFRFGTLLDETRLANYARANEGALREALARVAGCVEMGVKIMRGAGAEATEDEAEAPSWSSSPSSSTSPESPHAVGRGTAFLLAKRREILGGERERGRAAEVAALLDARVAEMVRASKVALLPSRALVVRAAHLVERVRLAEYRACVRALEAERAGALSFLTSGAWPPYSFSEIDST